ncbi:hypothetical protein [Flavobacterium subsaxonicum]|uniref:Uncharacterized protein n=1 Tax=Flavobacterium subsaxonicum WB 4.1-42 = DSM 21790 TaxID=1121898 RepID=A0A0A2MQC6_9FLAO|nr:hypothetical protein [Flavobacterium subsaxonicum]KGO93761.1 hypothetical protein Q766_07365 [Flavobacterium subsaxonicum WB 4.1-42 = DSM 21790]
MNKFLKELLWFCLTVIIAVAAFYVLQICNLSSLLIAFYDAVYVTDAIDIISILIIVFGFIIYLIRVLSLKFKNKTCNYIYIAYNVLLIIVISGAIHLNDKLSLSEGWTIYPPLSSPPQKVVVHNFIADPIYLIAIQFIVTVLFAITAFKIGEKSKHI